MTPDSTSAIHQEPSLRSWVEWTPERIKLAELQAAAGYLRSAADLCDALLSDDRVRGVLPTRARGLLGLPFSFERSARRASGHRAAVRALEAEEDWWTIAPNSQLAQINRWGILLGIGVAQLRWSPGPRSRLLPSLDTWHAHGLRRDAATGRWLISTADAGDVAVSPGDGQWVLHAPEGLKRPEGCWRAVARWWLLKQYARSDWGVQGERAAGIRVAKPPMPQAGSVQSEGSKANRQAIAEQLVSLARNGGMVLPQGWDLSIVQAAANTWETFQAQIELANAGIAIAVAGQNLTSEVKGGSYAAAQVHQQVANVLLRADAEALATTLHDQVLVPWASYNLAGPDAAPWPSWDTSPPEDLGIKVQTWSALIDATTKADVALARVGLEVDLEEVVRTAGIPTRPRSVASPAQAISDSSPTDTVTP